ncbi:MAG: HEPN domain-containing protein [Candidatus Korarchaeota archaeon]|nr:HEPN domain-containing protein [Candidatus Korarchaeota archaeon]
MSFLKRRAELFEEEAREAFDKGNYNFTLFFVEQALQLYLKYALLKQLGDFPKTHGLIRLFEALSSVVGDRAVRFLSENRVVLDLLAEAYVGSRYLDVEYGRETAEEALSLLERFKDEFDEEIR